MAAYGQFAVPFFFMVSGFFLFSNDREKMLKRMPKKIKHILFLCLVLYFINVLRVFIEHNFSFKAIWNWLSVEVFTVEHLLKFIILNDSAFSGVMWFLLALVYCYFVYIVLIAIKMDKKISKILPILLIVHLVNIVFDFIIPNVRFLFIGFPYFALGYTLKSALTEEKKEQLKQNRYVLWLMVILGIILLPIEAVVFNKYFFKVASNVLIVISIFILAVLYPTGLKNKTICFIGSELSLFVYMFHPLIIHLLEPLQGTFLEVIFLNEWIYPVWVLIITVLCSMLVWVIIAQVKKLKEKYGTKI